MALKAAFNRTDQEFLDMWVHQEKERKERLESAGKKYEVSAAENFAHRKRISCVCSAYSTLCNRSGNGFLFVLRMKTREFTTSTAEE